VGSRTPTHRLRWAILLIGAAVVVLVAYTGYQALSARRNLQRVAADFTTLAGQLTSGNQAGAQQTLADVQQHADAARGDTRGPGWWAATKLPGVGRDVVAVRTVADVSDELAGRVLPAVVRATAALRPDRLRPRNGRIDLAPISAVGPGVVRAADRLAQQSRRVGLIDTERLLGAVAAPVRQLQVRLRDATALSARASRAVRLLPPMLGADGPRTYLMYFANNAEVRSTGGLPGSFATVTARDGTVTLGNQGNAASVGRFSRPPVPLTADEQTLFGANMGVLPQDTNFTPDFPRTAELLAGMWNAGHRTQVDGVLATDPVALSYLLRGTGPVALPGGQQLTSRDAVSMLLNRVYASIADPVRQDDFFGAAARSVFTAVSSGQGQPRSVLENLVTAADQRRILLWSDRPKEQALLAPTRIGGSLRTRASAAPDVGVFLNNGGGSKLDYYLDDRVDVASDRCQAGRQHLTVTVHLRSQVPAEVAALAESITGPSVGMPRGTIRVTLYVYAPVGGYVAGATYDGDRRDLDQLSQDGRPLVSQTVDLEPGSRHTLTYAMVSGKGQRERTDLQVTPGARSDGIGSVGPSAC
jgi:hypothetical protein